MTRGKTNQTKGKTQTSEVEENAEPEVQVVEKIVEKPIKVKDMTPSERQGLISDIEQQNIQEHLEKEAKKIESTKCPKCGALLKLKAKDYMKRGNKPELKECSKCETIVRVFVNYKASPETSTADISVKPRGYAWVTQHPSNWEDKHVKRFVEDEKEKLENNASTFTEEGQKIFRIQLLILKKLKIIK